MKKALLLLLSSAVICSICTGCRETRYTYYGKDTTKINTEIQFDEDSGKPDGYAKIYYRNGKLKEEGRFKQGKKHGDYKRYYENGEVYEEGAFKDDKREGKRRWWDVNGVLEQEGYYKNGVYDGEWVKVLIGIKIYTLYKEGKKISEKVICSNGKKVFVENFVENGKNRCYDGNDKEVSCHREIASFSRDCSEGK